MEPDNLPREKNEEKKREKKEKQDEPTTQK
jgi:hypothetical protein